MEEFKEHPKHKGIKVGSKGTVVGIKGSPIGSVRSDGYHYAWIDSKFRYTHRLVYEAFNGVIPEDLEINHKDGNKLNNCIDNLECISHKQNVVHSYKELGRKVYKGVEHWNSGKTYSKGHRNKMSEAKKGSKHPKFKGYYCYNGLEYDTPKEIAELTGLSNRTIIRRCKANDKGFSFRPV